MIKKIFTIFGTLGVALILISWGSVGHRTISYNASLSFNAEMSEFNAWITYLADHASDADYRKYSTDPNYDPNESIRHYIDIDNYADFNSTSKIEQNYSAAVVKYGLLFINSDGTLPWATEVAFDSLRNSMERYDRAKAKQFAADLGHYVADGHMPLHITRNYDGQYTGNSGIHSRYESTMINAYSSQITYTGESISQIADVNQYIFDYIYANYKYKDSVLLADTYAKTIGNIGTTEYNAALWNKTKGYTTTLFKNGSHALSELIYTAWVQAGKPSLTSTAIQTLDIQLPEALEQNSPNPFSNHTSIKYNLTENSDVSLQVKDMLGNSVTTLFKGFKAAGSYSADWYPQNQHEGIYFIVLDTKKLHKVKKMMLVR